MKTKFTGELPETFLRQPFVNSAEGYTRPIFLIGFLEMGNLGIGYLCATLRSFGYTVRVFDIHETIDTITARAKAENPLIIGYSLIFQFYIDQYRDQIQALRRDGVHCHITMGGHFPSLAPKENLDYIPELDSVVQYEGELTLLELANALSSDQPWVNIPGIVTKRINSKGPCTQPRPLLKHLDDLPWPSRNYQAMRILGQNMMPLLASRGCIRTCSFCSIHVFYRSAPGKVVRTREPSEIVAEMKWLYLDKQTTIFLFQDDDFPVYGKNWQIWTRNFIKALYEADLVGKIIWKINCRADAVDPVLFREMQEAGLYLVYMGLESGDKEGLITLDKKISVEQNLKAVEILREMGLVFEFGFMLLDPSSSFASVKRNLAFLETITDDGRVAAVFCRMLPYHGTPIREQLAAQGRLLGDIMNPEYDFLDPRLDAFFSELNSIMHVSGWIHGLQAVSPAINNAWHEIAILKGRFKDIEKIEHYSQKLAKLTMRANQIVYDIVYDLIDKYEAGKKSTLNELQLKTTAEEIVRYMLKLRNDFIGKNQNVILNQIKTLELA